MIPGPYLLRISSSRAVLLTSFRMGLREAFIRPTNYTPTYLALNQWRESGILI